MRPDGYRELKSEAPGIDRRRTLANLANCQRIDPVLDLSYRQSRPLVLGSRDIDNGQHMREFL